MEELHSASRRLKTVRDGHIRRLNGEMQKIDVEEKRLQDKFHELDEKRKHVLPPKAIQMHLMMILLKSMLVER